MTADQQRAKYAVKIVRRTLRDRNETENDKCQQELDHEVSMWRYLSHKHILPLRAVFETDFATFCVMDLNEGGSLFDLVSSQRKSGTKGLSASWARSYSFQLACALRYLHQDARIVHRDVKLGNCLIHRLDTLADLDPGMLRLCDFGLAEFVTAESPDILAMDHRDNTAATRDGGTSNGDGAPAETRTATHILGSLEYASPESLHSEAPLTALSSDIWAYGVTVYALVTGDLPFRHTMQSKVLECIEGGLYDESAVTASLAAASHESDGAHIVQLLRGCLDTNPSTRWTIADVLESAWYASCGNALDG